MAEPISKKFKQTADNDDYDDYDGHPNEDCSSSTGEIQFLPPTTEKHDLSSIVVALIDSVVEQCLNCKIELLESESLRTMCTARPTTTTTTPSDDQNSTYQITTIQEIQSTLAAAQKALSEAQEFLTEQHQKFKSTCALSSPSLSLEPSAMSVSSLSSTRIGSSKGGDVKRWQQCDCLTTTLLANNNNNNNNNNKLTGGMDDMMHDDVLYQRWQQCDCLTTTLLANNNNNNNNNNKLTGGMDDMMHDDVLYHMFSYLDVGDLFSSASVNKRWSHMLGMHNTSFWTTVARQHFPTSLEIQSFLHTYTTIKEQVRQSQSCWWWWEQGSPNVPTRRNQMEFVFSTHCRFVLQLIEQPPPQQQSSNDDNNNNNNNNNKLLVETYCPPRVHFVDDDLFGFELDVNCFFPYLDLSKLVVKSTNNTSSDEQSQQLRRPNFRIVGYVLNQSGSRRMILNDELQGGAPVEQDDQDDYELLLCGNDSSKLLEFRVCQQQQQQQQQQRKISRQPSSSPQEGQQTSPSNNTTTATTNTTTDNTTTTTMKLVLFMDHEHYDRSNPQITYEWLASWCSKDYTSIFW